MNKSLKERDEENYKKDKRGTMQKWKKDWYDLDFCFVRDHPDFRGFAIYQYADNFKNTFLDFFSETAFADRREVVVEFYSRIPDNIDREYLWMTKQEMDVYIDNAVCFILEKVNEI